MLWQMMLQQYVIDWMLIKFKLVIYEINVKLQVGDMATGICITSVTSSEVNIV